MLRGKFEAICGPLGRIALKTLVQSPSYISGRFEYTTIGTWEGGGVFKASNVAGRQQALTFKTSKRATPAELECVLM